MLLGIYACAAALSGRMEICVKFFKENSYDIVRLYIQQIGISIFSLFLYFALEALPLEGDKTLLSVGLSVFSMLFLFVLVYAVAWEMGSKDKIRIDAGRMAYRPAKGLFLGLFADALNVLFVLLSLLFIGCDMLFDAQWCRIPFVIFNFLLRVTTAMYNGLMQGIFAFAVAEDNLYLALQTVGFLLISLLAVLVTHLGYTMGVKDRHFSQLFKLREPQGKKNKE